jgi:hypothetical protein
LDVAQVARSSLARIASKQASTVLQVVDGRVAERGSDGEHVVGARRPSGFAALDVAADERPIARSCSVAPSRSAGSGW